MRARPSAFSHEVGLEPRSSGESHFDPRPALRARIGLFGEGCLTDEALPAYVSSDDHVPGLGSSSRCSCREICFIGRSGDRLTDVGRLE